jgi:hypothetical protein
MQKRIFKSSDLVIVGYPTHEPVIVGDFVRLASGSPLGLVIECEHDEAEVAWLTGKGDRSRLPAVCLRPIDRTPGAGRKSGAGRH